MNLKNAKDLFFEIVENFSDEELKKFQKIHTPSVVNASLILAELNSIKHLISRDVLECSAWLHDIGYLIEEQNHAEHSINILNERGIKIEEKIFDCITNHGSKGNPNCSEAKILQVADKCSFINPEILRLIVMEANDKKLNEKDLDFIKKNNDSAIILLRKYLLSI